MTMVRFLPSYVDMMLLLYQLLWCAMDVARIQSQVIPFCCSCCHGYTLKYMFGNHYFGKGEKKGFVSGPVQGIPVDVILQGWESLKEKQWK